MAVITMPSTSSLVKTIKADFPEFKFVRHDDFVWASSEHTIYSPIIRSKASLWAFMHELAHAILGHCQFQTDVELVTKEAEAWRYATTVLATRYEQKIPNHYVEKQLDTYRDWLHTRSLCPICGQTGIQTQKNHYSCINCSGSWGVNDARRCSLRRYQVA